MRNSVVFFALAGFGQVLPSLMREFSGRVSWTIAAYPIRAKSPGPANETLIHARLRLDLAHVVAHRIGVNRPVVDRNCLFVRIDPSQRMLHPVDVVALGVILTRMRAAALEAVQR